MVNQDLQGRYGIDIGLVAEQAKDESDKNTELNTDHNRFNSSLKSPPTMSNKIELTN